MANYAFINISKLKSSAALTQTYKHNYRIESPANVDQSMSHLNDEAVKLEEKNLVEAFEKRKDSLEYYKTHTFRKDGVRAIELTLEYSPEAAKSINQEAWKKANVEWLEKTFNNQYGKNVVSVVFHYDEGAYAGAGAIHGHAVVIPVNDQGRISAKSFIGSKQQLSELQTSYAKAMSPFGLERGIKYSQAKHQDIRAMYGALNKDLEDKPIPERSEHESAEQYEEKLKTVIRSERAERHYENYLHQKEIKEIKNAYKSDPEKDAYIKALTAENTSLRDRSEHTEEMIREMGGMENVQKVVQNWKDLNYGIQHYPDEQVAVDTSENADRLLRWAKEEREKERKAKTQDR